MKAGEASRMQTQEAAYAGQLDFAGAQQQQALDYQEVMGEVRQEDFKVNQMQTLLGMSQAEQAGFSQAAQNYAGQQGKGWGVAGQVIGTGLGVKMMFMCVPKGIYIDCVDKKVAIENIKPGDTVIGYHGNPVKVLQKHEYLEDPSVKRFYKIKFNNGAVVDTCDMHKIKGIASKDIIEDVKSKEVYNGVEFSYDLLTEDLGYRINDIPINSMIEEMAEKITKLKNK